jgi:hypothetical protein
MTTTARAIESVALAVALGGGIVGAVAALVGLGGQPATLGGPGSVGGIAATAAVLTGAPTFAWGYVRSSHSEVRWRIRSAWRRVLDTVGLTLTGSAMAGLLIVSVFTVFQLAFQELSLDPFAAALICAVTVGVGCYALFLLASQITTSRLASLLGLFLLAGVFSSMLSADDPRWWQQNFSYLGMGGTASAQAFNLTVIIAGLVITTLADYLTLDLRSRNSSSGVDLRGVTVVRVALVVIGVALMGVGFSPVDLSVVVHNVFAISALAGFGLLLVLTPIVLRDLPRGFVVTTYLFVGVIAVVVLLFVPFGYYNLTAVELLAVLVIFAWLVLFTRNATPVPAAATPAPAEGEIVARAHASPVRLLVTASLSLAVGVVAGRLSRRR